MLDTIRNLFSSGEKAAPIVHKASMIRTRVIAIFIPTENFQGLTDNGALLGMYKKNCRYYIRENNAMLEALCAKWETKGLIKIKRGK